MIESPTRFSAAWLLDQRFPPVEYTVPGVIPEGLALLVAPPKLGKSWLQLGISLSVSVGGLALGCIEVQRRPVLNLSLEDGPRRLQDRLRTLGAQIGAADLEFVTRVEGDVLELIRTWLADHAEDKPLVVIDTLGKVRGTYQGSDRYGHDYAQAGALKALVDQVPGAAMVVVHHTSKAGRDDFVDSVSGTHGLAGAADTILTLTRDRHDGAGLLNVTSRDAAEGRYAVTFDDGQWTLDGDSLVEAAQQVHNRAASEGVGDDMGTILAVVQRHPEGIQRKRIIEESGLGAAKVDTYLNRAVESKRITRSGRGLYTPVSSERSVRFEEDPDDPKLTHLTQLTRSQRKNWSPDGGVHHED